jgi:hypothetical protein
MKRKSDDAARIKSEAQSLIELGNLLKRKRSPEQQEQIEQIIHSSRETEAKIAEIKRIDSESSVASNEKRHKKHRAAEDTERINRFGRRDTQESQRIKRKKIINNRHSVKKLPSYNSFFRYLFSDFRKIKEFGIKHRLLCSSIIPGKLRVNRNAGVLLTKSLKPTARELLPLLEKVIEEGWKFLTKADYNLVVIMKDLAKKVIDIPFVHYKPSRRRNLLDRYFDLENLFICLHYRENYPQRIIDSFETVYENLSEGIEKTEDGIIKIKRLLFPDVTLPSLQNFILMLNMLKFRKFVSLQDLINPKTGKIVETNRFDCSRSIQSRINALVNDMKHEILILYRKEKEVKELKTFLPLDNEKMLEFTPLKKVYEAAGGNEYQFEKDKEKILVFVPRFYYAFSTVYGSLLTGKVEVENLGPVRIFKEVFFNSDLNRLLRTAEKIEQLGFKSPVFPKKRFLQIKKDRSQAITVEIEIMQLLDEGILIFRELAEKLTEIIRRDKSDTDRQLTTPIDPVYVEKDNFSIPFAYNIITNNPFCSGKTVRLSLSSIVTVLFLYLLYIEDSYTKNLINQDQDIRRDINTKMEVLERIAVPDEFAEIKEQLI